MAAIKRTEADKWFSKCVRERDGWACRHCGAHYPKGSRGLECAHIHSRRHKSVRWWPDNAIALCTHCHFEFTGEPLEFARWLTMTLGDRHLDALRRERDIPRQVRKQDRSAITKHYRDEYHRMQHESCMELRAWEWDKPL